MTTCESCKHCYPLGNIHGCRKHNKGIFKPQMKACYEYKPADEPADETLLWYVFKFTKERKNHE